MADLVTKRVESSLQRLRDGEACGSPHFLECRLSLVVQPHGPNGHAAVYYNWYYKRHRLSARLAPSASWFGFSIASLGAEAIEGAPRPHVEAAAAERGGGMDLFADVVHAEDLPLTPRLKDGDLAIDARQEHLVVGRYR